MAQRSVQNVIRHIFEKLCFFQEIMSGLFPSSSVSDPLSDARRALRESDQRNISGIRQRISESDQNISESGSTAGRSFPERSRNLSENSRNISQALENSISDKKDVKLLTGLSAVSSDRQTLTCT